MSRIGVLTAFALLGFLIGIAVYSLMDFLAPLIVQVLLASLKKKWVLAGVLGALTSVITVVVWAYATSD